MRAGPVILRVYAHALLAAGQFQAARDVATGALAESRRYDAPTASSIAEAESLVAEADAGLRGGPSRRPTTTAGAPAGR